MAKPESQRPLSIFYYSDEMGRFEFGPDHPFKPERATKTYDLCNRYGVLNYPWMEVRQPDPIDPQLLTLFHEPGYLHLLEASSRGEVRLEMLERGLGTPDTPILKGIFDWSIQAAGGTHAAMQEILGGRARTAFNPLGGFHHAMPGHAEGFCYINDIAIAIMAALRASPELKIAYVDLDAHHGNGVQEAFFRDPRVLVLSLHETGKTLYPWSGNETEIGEGEGRGFTVNVPLEPGTDDEVYSFVLETVAFPLLKSFAPTLIVAELGADTLISDPLTHLKLTNNGYQKAVRGIVAICPRILALGGGGYDLYRTSRCWTLAWSILNHVEPVDEFAGLVGGMMFGPEKEVGSLYDHPYFSKGEVKEKAFAEARRVVAYLQREVLPLHGISSPSPQPSPPALGERAR
ncbi:MAG: acetoin utilization protein AcuC [Deltaproteobacteria bacterium]|nr:acetoin utilization protein AcuC [Deltaproteobacteria bacterium]